MFQDHEQSKTQAITNFPWQPESTIIGNLAWGLLRINIIKRLTVENKLHVETLITAIGALVGFAAQNAALSQAAMLNALPRHSVVLLGTKDNQKYLIGEFINQYLFIQPQNVPHNLLNLNSLLFGKANALGLHQNDFPDVREIATHVAATLGNADFGKIRASAQHHPHMSPLELLQVLWPIAKEIFTRTIVQHGIPNAAAYPAGVEEPLKEIYWPIVSSLVASQLLAMIKDKLDLRLACALCFEAAVITAKIDPELIEPGKWDIKAQDGSLKVKRLRN